MKKLFLLLAWLCTILPVIAEDYSVGESKVTHQGADKTFFFCESPISAINNEQELLLSYCIQIADVQYAIPAVTFSWTFASNVTERKLDAKFTSKEKLELPATISFTNYGR